MSNIPFLSDDFLLTTQIAQKLYHDFAKAMPIFDYHCHLPPAQIAEDVRFENITQLWLAGDHYKWRAMRSNGVDEQYCTGKASDKDKFLKWAETLPYAIGNPLFVWSHLELKRYFGIDELLTPSNASEIYERCSEMVRSPEFSVRNLLKQRNVMGVCTTDDPADSLSHHLRIAADGFSISVKPAFRPDKYMAQSDPVVFNRNIKTLEQAAGIAITSFTSLREALDSRHKFFHDMGCRISDHGMTSIFSRECPDKEADSIFKILHCGTVPSPDQVEKFNSAFLRMCSEMDARRDWTQQLHFGVLRNTNSRMFAALGPDSGFDTIGDPCVASDLARLLDSLAINATLPRTVLYTINAKDNDVLATLCGCFQSSDTPAKIQFGSGWWFHDQRDGMEKQMKSLMNMGLLSRFIGMTTDSRSFLSFPRHEYFRRTLCKLLGELVAIGEAPDDISILGPMVKNICNTNAISYFKFNQQEIKK